MKHAIQQGRTSHQVTRERVEAVLRVSSNTSSTRQAAAAHRVRQYPRWITENQARAALKILKGSFNIEKDNLDGVSEDALQEFPANVVEALVERWPAGEYPIAHRILELGDLIQLEFAGASLDGGEPS